MSEPKNSVATVKQEADKKILWQKFTDYVEDNPVEIFIDYRDELSKEQINKVLEGKCCEVSYEIEDSASANMDLDDYYWTEMAEKLEVDGSLIEEWLSEEGIWPGCYLSEYGWNKLLSNTPAMISATVWEASYDFYNWAYGGPVFYSDVKESLKILGINPLDFKRKFDGESISMGGKHGLKGWFPDMPDRVPAVNIDDLQPQVLYNGVMSFCLGDLSSVADVVSSDSKNLTFKKGTNVVVYDYGNGAGICEFPLTRDVTIPRKKVEFRNDDDIRYGIQECYGFIQSYWNDGEVENGK